MTLTVIVIYLLLVLAIGVLGQRFFRGTGEDYFVATRSIGPFILLMSLFGTHMTAFSLMGASAEAYHQGLGVFSLMASSSALVVPAVFFFVGIRVAALGRRNGYLTQIQFFRNRWDSEALALLLFVVLVALLVPYLLIGVMGGGITLSQITGGRVPEWAGSVLICAVVMTYVTAGGVRATAWANTFQTLVFMSLGAVTFLVIVGKSGGLASALARVDPELMIHGAKIPAFKLLTYTCIPLSVGMFPHIFMHWLTAQRSETFRLPVIAYPVCIAVVWVPSVVLGVLGTVDFPGLEGPAANSILIRMIGLYAPGVLAGLLAAGVFAAVMSSLDSQVLSISSLVTQDLVRHLGLHDRMSEARQVLVGRLFVAGVLAVTFVLSLVSNRSIFRLGVWSFTGFAALFPLVLAALYWRRSTKHGAFACILSVVVLWTYYIARGWEHPGYTVGGTGIMPVAVILSVSSVAMVVVSLLTPAPDPSVVARFFPSQSWDPGGAAQVGRGCASTAADRRS